MTKVPRNELAVGVEDSEGEVKPVGLTPKSQRANELDLNGLNGLWKHPNTLPRGFPKTYLTVQKEQCLKFKYLNISEIMVLFWTFTWVNGNSPLIVEPARGSISAFVPFGSTALESFGFSGLVKSYDLTRSMTFLKKRHPWKSVSSVKSVCYPHWCPPENTYKSSPPRGHHPLTWAALKGRNKYSCR